MKSVKISVAREIGRNKKSYDQFIQGLSMMLYMLLYGLCTHTHFIALVFVSFVSKNKMIFMK